MNCDLCTYGDGIANVGDERIDENDGWKRTRKKPRVGCGSKAIDISIH